MASLKRPRAWIIVAAVLLLIVSAVSLALVFNPWANRFDPTLRSLVLVAPHEQLPAQRARFLRTELVAGEAPREVARGTVMTDTNCEADAEGVSHCLSIVKLGAREIEVQHHHKMLEVPCLNPTEQVNVMSLATYAALAPGQLD